MLRIHRCRVCFSEMRIPPIRSSARTCFSATSVTRASARESSPRTLRFSIFRAQIFSRGGPLFSGGQVQSSMDSVVSIAICQRSRRQRLRSARASLVRKTISSSGCRAMTKSSPSHLIATCRRYSMDPSPMRDQYIPPHPPASLPVDPVHLYLCRSPLRLELSHFRSRWILVSWISQGYNNTMKAPSTLQHLQVL